jgi:proline dehydrogenase
MSIARRLFLAASTSVWLRDRATKAPFVRRSVARFMPGERLEDALAAAREPQSLHIGAILTRLGENVTRIDEAETVTRHYLDVMDAAQAAGLDAQISIKPTQLGLDLDKTVCARNLETLVERASLGSFVWIDMESSPYVDPTLDLFRRIRERSPRVGVCLQAYLRRTARDIDSLLPLGASIRLVKGAYLEPAEIAFPDKRDVDENFYRLSCRLLEDAAQRAEACLHIATHDPVLIRRVNGFISDHRVRSGAYEYAMLYGIQRQLQLNLAGEGRRVRVLISYGDYWFPWYMRRLAERPANIWFVLSNLFGR